MELKCILWCLMFYCCFGLAELNETDKTIDEYHTEIEDDFKYMNDESNIDGNWTYDTLDDLTADLTHSIDELSSILDDGHDDNIQNDAENIETLFEHYENTYIKNKTWFNVDGSSIAHDKNEINPTKLTDEIVESVHEIVNEFEKNNEHEFDKNHHQDLVEHKDFDESISKNQHNELSYGNPLLSDNNHKFFDKEKISDEIKIIKNQETAKDLYRNIESAEIPDNHEKINELNLENNVRILEDVHEKNSENGDEYKLLNFFVRSTVAPVVIPEIIPTENYKEVSNDNHDNIEKAHENIKQQDNYDIKIEKHDNDAEDEYKLLNFFAKPIVAPPVVSPIEIITTHAPVITEIPNKSYQKPIENDNHGQILVSKEIQNVNEHNDVKIKEDSISDEYKLLNFFARPIITPPVVPPVEIITVPPKILTTTPHKIYDEHLIAHESGYNKAQNINEPIKSDSLIIKHDDLVDDDEYKLLSLFARSTVPPIVEIIPTHKPITTKIPVKIYDEHVTEQKDNIHNENHEDLDDDEYKLLNLFVRSTAAPTVPPSIVPKILTTTPHKIYDEPLITHESGYNKAQNINEPIKSDSLIIKHDDLVDDDEYKLLSLFARSTVPPIVEIIPTHIPITTRIPVKIYDEHDTEQKDKIPNKSHEDLDDDEYKLLNLFVRSTAAPTVPPSIIPTHPTKSYQSNQNSIHGEIEKVIENENSGSILKYDEKISINYPPIKNTIHPEHDLITSEYIIETSTIKHLKNVDSENYKNEHGHESEIPKTSVVDDNDIITEQVLRKHMEQIAEISKNHSDDYESDHKKETQLVDYPKRQVHQPNHHLEQQQLAHHTKHNAEIQDPHTSVQSFEIHQEHNAENHLVHNSHTSSEHEAEEHNAESNSEYYVQETTQHHIKYPNEQHTIKKLPEHHIEQEYKYTDENILKKPEITEIKDEYHKTTELEIHSSPYDQIEISKTPALSHEFKENVYHERIVITEKPTEAILIYTPTKPSQIDQTKLPPILIFNPVNEYQPPVQIHNSEIPVLAQTERPGLLSNIATILASALNTVIRDKIPGQSSQTRNLDDNIEQFNDIFENKRNLDDEEENFNNNLYPIPNHHQPIKEIELTSTPVDEAPLTEIEKIIDPQIREEFTKDIIVDSYPESELERDLTSIILEEHAEKSLRSMDDILSDQVSKLKNQNLTHDHLTAKKDHKSEVNEYGAPVVIDYRDETSYKVPPPIFPFPKMNIDHSLNDHETNEKEDSKLELNNHDDVHAVTPPMEFPIKAIYSSNEHESIRRISDASYRSKDELRYDYDTYEKVPPVEFPIKNFHLLNDNKLIKTTNKPILIEFNGEPLQYRHRDRFDHPTDSPTDNHNKIIPKDDKLTKPIKTGHTIHDLVFENEYGSEKIIKINDSNNKLNFKTDDRIHEDLEHKSDHYVEDHKYFHSEEHPGKSILKESDHKLKPQGHMEDHEYFHGEAHPDISIAEVSDYNVKPEDQLEDHEYFHSEVHPGKSLVPDHNVKSEDHMEDHKYFHSEDHPDKSDVKVPDHNVKSEDHLEDHKYFHSEDHPVRSDVKFPDHKAKPEDHREDNKYFQSEVHPGKSIVNAHDHHKNSENIKIDDHVENHKYFHSENHPGNHNLNVPDHKHNQQGNTEKVEKDQKYFHSEEHLKNTSKNEANHKIEKLNDCDHEKITEDVKDSHFEHNDDKNDIKIHEKPIIEENELIDDRRGDFSNVNIQNNISPRDKIIFINEHEEKTENLKHELVNTDHDTSSSEESESSSFDHFGIPSKEESSEEKIHTKNINQTDETEKLNALQKIFGKNLDGKLEETVTNVPPIGNEEFLIDQRFSHDTIMSDNKSRSPRLENDDDTQINKIEVIVKKVKKAKSMDTIQMDEEEIELLKKLDHSVIKKDGVDLTQLQDDIEIIDHLLIESTTITPFIDENNSSTTDEAFKTLIEAVELTSDIKKSIDSFRSTMAESSSILESDNQIVTSKNTRELVEIGLANVMAEQLKNSDTTSLQKYIYISSFIALTSFIVFIIIFIIRKSKRYGGLDFVPV